MVVDLSSVLDKFVLVFRQSAAVQKYGGPKTIGVKILAKFFWYIAPCKKGGPHRSNVCGYFMSIASGDTVFVVPAGG